jgi:hypothetical protein
MYIPFFVVIWLVHIQASPPVPSNYISPLYGTSWSTREHTGQCHISRTVCRYFSSSHVQNKCGSSCRLASSRRNIVDKRAGGRPKDRWRQGQHIAAVMEGLNTEVGTIELFPLAFSWIAMLSFFCPLVKRFENPKSVSKMWKLPVENQMILLLPTVLWHQGLLKYVKCHKQKWFYNAELLCEEVENHIYSTH